MDRAARTERTERDGAAGDSKGLALYLRLRDDVLAGVFPPGAPLSESELGRRYGSSRTPIREAVARLERDGLLLRSGMIARIRRRTAEEVIDIYRIRVFLERAIARDAARRRRDGDLLRLTAALAAEGAVDRGDQDAVQAANRRLHLALATAAHNDTLLDLQQRLTLQVAAIPGTTLTRPGRWETAHAEHARIVAAVHEGDADTAGAVAETHMRTACDLRLAMLADSG